MTKRLNIILTKVLLISTFCFIMSSSVFSQDSLQKKEKTKHKFISHQFCFGPQWIKWAYEKYYTDASVQYFRQSYLAFYKIVYSPKELGMKFAINLNGAYSIGEGYYMDNTLNYLNYYRGKFENYWLDINPNVYFAFEKSRNFLIGGGPFYGRLLYSQNDITYTRRFEPIGSPPSTTITKDDKILNRYRAGVTLELQQKIVVRNNLGIVVGLKFLLTTTDGFAGTLVPAVNPYLGIGF